MLKEIFSLREIDTEGAGDFVQYWYRSRAFIDQKIPDLKELNSLELELKSAFKLCSDRSSMCSVNVESPIFMNIIEYIKDAPEEYGEMVNRVLKELEKELVK